MENYRTIIEVLKFADPADVLRKACIVHSKWSEVSASRELWYLYLPEDTDLACQHPKLVYHRRFTQSVFIVIGSKLLRFYLGSSTWSELPLSREVALDYTSSITRPELEFLFVCGATARRENTFKVGVRTGEIRLLPALNPHRIAMGVVTHEGCVYAFNGKKGTEGCVNCDKFDVKRGVWTQLPFSIEKRAFFNPCVSRGLAYLIGGTHQPTPCEAYSFAANSFASIPLEIGFANAVSVMSGSKLVIVSNSKVTTAKLTTKGTKTTAKKLPHTLKQYFWSGFDPIFKNGLLIVAHRGEGRIVELDIASLDWKSYPYEGDIIAPRIVVHAPRFKRGQQAYYNANPAPAAPTNTQNQA